MSYNLTRVDYLLSGITFPDTLKVLPVTESGASTRNQKWQITITSHSASLGANHLTFFNENISKNKGFKIDYYKIFTGFPMVQSCGFLGNKQFAVGDKNGVLQSIAIKDEEPFVQFKTLPGKPITALQLSSIAGIQSDKIFAASGNEVKGYTRKGKVFFSIETSLSETITSMCVIGSDLVLGSGRNIIHYRDGKEFSSYACEDRVLDLTSFSIPNSTRLRLITLEANKGVTVLEDGNYMARTYINSGPSKLFVPNSGHDVTSSTFYGSADGSIGILTYDGSNLTAKCLVEGSSLGPVMCIGWYENDEGSHIAVGRHDGSIQLYLVDTEDLCEIPRLKFTYFCGEPVTSVAGGYVSSDDSELLASTFSGRIFALRPHQLTSMSSSVLNVSQDALTMRRSKLEAEVLRLEKQAVMEREKYQKNSKNFNSGISVPPLLDFQCELLDATNNGYQEIRIMTAVPLDMLFLYCKQILEIETDNAAVLSMCPSQGQANDLLATVRCQAGTRHLWIRVRYPKLKSPSNSTKLLIYAFPAGAPRVARMVTLRLPFLPFYFQHEDLESVENDSNRCWCVITAAGKFSVAEMTSWLSEALTGDLPRPSSLVAFARSHSLVNTVLICRYQKNQATFKCENISTIATLKKLLSDRSVEKVSGIAMDCDIPVNFCLKQFRRIEELYKSEYAKYKDSRLFKALKSLDLDSNALEDEEPTLCDDYMRVSKLSNADIDTNFQEIVEIVENWYASWNTLLLRPQSEALREKSLLNHALYSCDVEKIEEILSKNLNI